MKKFNNFVIDNYKNYKVKGLNKELVEKEIVEFFKSSSLSKKEISDELIVNLTSFPERMKDIHYTIFSLLSQSLSPKKVILWLSVHDYPNYKKDLPKKILQFEKKGLVIEFVEGINIKVYNKLIPALKKYPDSVHITADDDIFYPNNWLEGLYRDYLNYGSNYIYAYRVHRISVLNGQMYQYRKWKKEIKTETASYLNFLTGVGGVLYPVDSFNREVLREDKYLDLAPGADDIWYWAMATLNNKKIKVTPGFNGLVYVNVERELRLTGEKTLASQNVKLGGNDLQLKKVLSNYPKILDKLQAESMLFEMTGNLSQETIDFIKNISNDIVRLELCSIIKETI